MRLDESNKKNEFLRNQFSSQDEKMKSLEQELVESKADLKKLSCTKPVVDDKSVSMGANCIRYSNHAGRGQAQHLIS